MAYLITTTGFVEELEGKPTLEQLQKIVGGLIEYVPIHDGGYMYCNEEGKLLGLPPNPYATELIDFGDVIVGDVVVMQKGEEEE